MSNIIVFVNHVGQTLIAEQLQETKDNLKIKNPAILHVVPNQTGQLQVQLIPYFFKEFIEPKARKEGAIFNFDKSKVVSSEIKLEPKLAEQYNRIFSDTPVANATSQQGGEASVIKLFDE
jgi:hypothetical protein